MYLYVSKYRISLTTPVSGLRLFYNPFINIIESIPSTIPVICTNVNFSLNTTDDTAKFSIAEKTVTAGKRTDASIWCERASVRKFIPPMDTPAGIAYLREEISGFSRRIRDTTAKNANIMPKEIRVNSFMYNPGYMLWCCFWITEHIPFPKKVSPIYQIHLFWKVFLLFFLVNKNRDKSSNAIPINLIGNSGSLRNPNPYTTGITTEYEAIREVIAMEPFISAIYPQNVLTTREKAYMPEYTNVCLCGTNPTKENIRNIANAQPVLAVLKGSTPDLEDEAEPSYVKADCIEEQAEENRANIHVIIVRHLPIFLPILLWCIVRSKGIPFWR